MGSTVILFFLEVNKAITSFLSAKIYNLLYMKKVLVYSKTANPK